MISAKCFTQEWVEEKSVELGIHDKNLIEKVIHAFALLDLLAQLGCPFHFTGVPYFKNGKSSSLEIIKQLYDIGRLFERVDDLSITARVFKSIGEIELGYRDLPLDVSIIYDDIRNTALNLSLRGLVDQEKFALLQDGINRFKPFVYTTPYYIENAIVDASKAAYLATLLKFGVMRVEKYSGDLSSLPEMTTVSNWFNKLNKLKKLNPEAYFYWVKAFTVA